MQSFDEALLAVYRRQPCRVLPNALWKTLAQVDDFVSTFVVERDRVIQLHMQRDDALLMYWRADRALSQFPKVVWPSITFALLHDDVIKAVPSGLSLSREAYFRMQWDTALLPDFPLPQGFGLADVDMAIESQVVARFITQCYDAIAVTGEDVLGWSRLPVFVPGLAFWIVDTACGVPAALGISHYDPRVPEVSLEWIQVHPAYRGRGLGKALVREMLRRARDLAGMVTVSGAVASAYHPSALYRRCGFHGDDVWWVLRR